jgi:hypothetical protein
MFNKTRELRAFKMGHPQLTISQTLRVCVLTIVPALACVAVTGPAFARSPYDGDWSVVIVTHGGACDSTFRYGVQISNGTVSNSGDSPAAVQGRVAPSGAIRVTVRSGSEWADGSGHLNVSGGSGVWRGQGSAGACDGTWVAQRRSVGIEAQATGAPLYDYAPGTISPQGNETGSRDVAYCEAHFRSYNLANGTYLGMDGARHTCP